MSIDFHCHLQDDLFSADIDQVIGRAKAHGVTRFFCNAVRPLDWIPTLQLARRFPEIVPCLGLHPIYVDETLDPDWAKHFRMALRISDKTFAMKTPIGEIGLDHFVQPRDESLQEIIFREQLQIAREQCRAVMLHTRYSLDRVVEILREEGPFPVLLFHGFSGPLERVSQILKLNGYFSFSANLLKPHHKRTRGAAVVLPLDRILLESDAPDMFPPLEMAPEDWTPNRNEPMIIPKILDELAAIRGIPVSELAEMIKKNEDNFQNATATSE